MKNFFYTTICAILLLCNSCKTTPAKIDAVGSTDTTHFAELKYIEDFYDFGSIKSGEVVTYTFQFKNIGNSPLIIKDVIPSCGCTTTKLSKNVFEANEVGKIEVSFNSTGWYGSQYKSVTLRTNSIIREKSVTIKANVVK